MTEKDDATNIIPFRRKTQKDQPLNSFKNKTKNNVSPPERGWKYYGAQIFMWAVIALSGVLVFRGCV